MKRRIRREEVNDDEGKGKGKKNEREEGNEEMKDGKEKFERLRGKTRRK